MNRLLITDLAAWANRSDRQPLVLRGARQVGKTWLVRECARQANRDLVEVNFERDPALTSAFDTSNPHEVIGRLSMALDRALDVSSSLLFLDEIQAAPAALRGLRWFSEEMPELPVVAAGSLLELTLAELEISMPVGRVTYRHLEPMSFLEFLRAHEQETLLENLMSWHPGVQIDNAVHEAGKRWYQRFAMVGGMPGVVQLDVTSGSPEQCRRAQIDLVATYRDDFAKYARQLDPALLDAVLIAVANQLGQKFVYSRAADGKRQLIKRALELLARARVVTLAPHTAANGLPLGGETRMRHRKATLLDVGLMHALLRTSTGPEYPRSEDLAPIVRGQLAEQLGSQQLRCLDPDKGHDPELHYWQRSGGRPGEIDHLVQIGLGIVPVEMKAGSAGSMKSLHQFMHDKGLELAVRVDVNPPSLQQMDVKTTVGNPARYQLLNLPGYLLFRVRELVEEVAAG